jgi:hypothetical protein
MQDATDQQRVRSLLPVIVRIQSVSLRVDHKEGQVLDIANLVFSADAELGHRIETPRAA